MRVPSGKRHALKRISVNNTHDLAICKQEIDIMVGHFFLVISNNLKYIYLMMIISLIISHWLPRMSPKNSGLIFTCLHFLARFQKDYSKMAKNFNVVEKWIKHFLLHWSQYNHVAWILLGHTCTCMQNATLMRQHCTFTWKLSFFTTILQNAK